jgi:hypothetical protein
MLPEDSEPAMHVLEAGQNHQNHRREKSGSAEHRDQISAFVRIDHPAHIRHDYTLSPLDFASIPWSQEQTYRGSINERLTNLPGGLLSGGLVKTWLKIRIVDADRPGRLARQRKSDWLPVPCMMNSWVFECGRHRGLHRGSASKPIRPEPLASKSALEELAVEESLRSPDRSQEFYHFGLQALVFVRKQLSG